MKQRFPHTKNRNLTMENITDLDYQHAERVWKDFGIQNLADYYDLYVTSDTLLLGDVFRNVRSKYLELYEIDPAHFLSALGLLWQACLKKTNVELELLTDTDMLL